MKKGKQSTSTTSKEPNTGDGRIFDKENDAEVKKENVYFCLS